MKKVYFFVAIMLLGFVSFAQNENVFPVNGNIEIGEYVLLPADTNGVDYSHYYGIVEVYNEMGVDYFSFGQPITAPIQWNDPAMGYHSLYFTDAYYYLITFNNDAIILYYPEKDFYYAVMPLDEYKKVLRQN